ncbi:unnamed protein product [Brachionus calyciflorus]|uniref:Uncharacterized protein n=1 Tax=Brachionus calyciflorus TaxID=104777 RepID=A0A813YMY1_9BILA|nr:unnamed protein product [Brachionus calyciflorus]
MDNFDYFKHLNKYSEMLIYIMEAKTQLRYKINDLKKKFHDKFKMSEEQFNEIINDSTKKKLKHFHKIAVSKWEPDFSAEIEDEILNTTLTQHELSTKQLIQEQLNTTSANVTISNIDTLITPITKITNKPIKSPSEIPKTKKRKA